MHSWSTVYGMNVMLRFLKRSKNKNKKNKKEKKSNGNCFYATGEKEKHGWLIAIVLCSH